MSHPGPLLSVVVPIYRVEEYIAEALDSLARQTVTDLEVIMVDDGSPDDSAAIAEQFAERDPRFRLIRQANAGPGPARNTGIDAATGRYLAFCDPDDLVPWRAYEWMLETIRRTGSSLVSGNARRFNRSGGVRQSWTHAQPFAATRDATHIAQFTPLLRDRMVWNTVYRRDFWDEHGLRFPAIRYEDYPIALQAHLLATTVDVMARHVYYWRERESGDSITQQTFRYDNMLDRVISAEMVCRIVAGTRGALRRAVHAYLADVDLTAMGQAFESVADDETEALIGLGRRLCAALDPGVLRSRPRFANLQYAAIQRGDVELLRELARFRSGGGLVGGVRVGPSVVPGRVTTFYPGRRPGPWPGRLYTMPQQQLSLITRTRTVSWDDDDLVVGGTAEIKHLRVGADSELTVELVGGATRIPLELTRHDGLDSHAERSLVGFTVRIPSDLLRSYPMIVWPLRFDVTLRVGRVSRRGRLAGSGGGSPVFSPVRELTEGVWVNLGRSRHGVTALHRSTRPPVADSITADGDDVVISGRVWDHPPTLELVVAGGDDQRRRGREPDRVVTASVRRIDDATSRFTARVPARELVHSVIPADPYTRESSWPLRVRTDLADRPLLWPRFTDTVAVGLDDGQVMTIRRSTTGGTVRVFTGPPEPGCDRLGVTATDLTLSGVAGAGAEPTRLAWRRFLPDSDDYVEREVGFTTDPDGRWHATTGLLALTTDLDDHHEPGAPRADWALFAVTAAGAEPTVRLEPQAMAGLPVDLTLGGHHVTLTERRETLHVEVR